MQNVSKNNFLSQPVGLVASDYINAVVLAAGVAKRISVPAGANYVKFSSTAFPYYVRWSTTIDATVPVADVTDGSAPELNPDQANIRSLTSFSIISPSACTVTASFYG
jgi:hypothetical protein